MQADAIALCIATGVVFPWVPLAEGRAFAAAGAVFGINVCRSDPGMRPKCPVEYGAGVDEYFRT